jgi:hypothetical protein
VGADDAVVAQLVARLASRSAAAQFGVEAFQDLWRDLGGRQRAERRPDVGAMLVS